MYDQIMCHVIQICLLDGWMINYYSRRLARRWARNAGKERLARIFQDLEESAGGPIVHARVDKRLNSRAMWITVIAAVSYLWLTRTYKRWPFVLALIFASRTYVTNPRWSAWLRTRELSSCTCKCTSVTAIEGALEFWENMRYVPTFRHRKPRGIDL